MKEWRKYHQCTIKLLDSEHQESKKGEISHQLFPLNKIEGQILDMNLSQTNQWQKTSCLKSETGRFIAAEDQSIKTAII